MNDAQYAFEKLEIWKIGMEIVKETYKITRKFPKDELFALTSQMRRASTSIPLNIAEGSSRRSKKDFSVFLRRSIGSTIELVTAVRVAAEQGYTRENGAIKLEELLKEEYYKTIAFERKISGYTSSPSLPLSSF